MNHTSHYRKPNVESLENRRVMTADYVVLDFTPDMIPGVNQPGSFVDTFIEHVPSAPRYLDFNGNGMLDRNDVDLAVNQITSKVQELFGNYATVLSFDVWGDTGFGQYALNWGINSPSLVDVVYVGGNSFQPGVEGMAEYQAPVGYNLEHYAHVYTTEIAKGFSYWDSSTAFADYTAVTIAHEVGHLLGAGHVIGHPTGDWNLMNYSAPSEHAHFQNGWFYSELVDRWGNRFHGWQNTADELHQSYTTQNHYTPSQLNLPSNASGHYHRETNVGSDHDLGREVPLIAVPATGSTDDEALQEETTSASDASSWVAESQNATSKRRGPSSQHRVQVSVTRVELVDQVFATEFEASEFDVPLSSAWL